jgi:DEAD/DEAH box helicase domain-containing protein
VERFVATLAASPELGRRLARVREEPPRAAEYAELPALHPAVAEALRQEGKHRLYRHQREAIDHALAGRNVVVATETSSGKSLCFQLPVLSACAESPDARALFVFPTNPLANDQEASLARLIARLPQGARPRGPVKLHGGLGAQKDQLAASDPQVVLTNPEMVQLHLLPQHRRWARFWAGLRYIVVDEVHLYRGAFGGHVAQLLRRVRRCAWRYGARPVVIAASATVGNPKALAEELCAAPFELVERSTAPRGPRKTVLWRPGEGRGSVHLDEAVDLFRRALDTRLQCILFARSRQLVEALATRLEERTGKSRIQLGVRAYRGGYTRDEREVIEQGLRAGTVRGVITTNALEVGIDIGSLDVCIMAGYPGSLMAMRQQAGRVGRRERSSAIFLVASQNPLDAYLVQHPELLEDAPSEKAVLGRLNPHVLRAHLACAASEFPLWEAEIERLGGDVARRAAQELVERGELRWGVEGERRVLLCGGRPHHGVSLRSASQERWGLVDPDGEAVGELDASAVAREAFPGAIYLHQGRTFRVDRHEPGRVHLKRAAPGHSTKVQGERAVSVREATRVVALPGAQVQLAPVDVVDRYDGYLEMAPQRTPRARKIEPPVTSELRSEGLVLRVSAQAATRHSSLTGLPFAASMHALEHLLTAFGATFVLCDRDDLEGHAGEVAGAPAVVLFDRHTGGLGFAASAFELIEPILARAAEAVESCPCADGCPACVHTGRCLRGNEDVSKEGARVLLRLIRGLDVGRVVTARPPVHRPRPKPKGRADEFDPRPGGKQTESDRPWSEAFAPGDRVEHAVYGEGTVLELRPSGRVVVDFGDGKGRRITPGWLRKARLT